jgi:hypothetical protein
MHGEQADFRRRRLLQFAVRPAMHVILPYRHVALLRQRMRDCAGIGSAERLHLIVGQPDHDFVLDGHDLEQADFVLLRLRSRGAGHKASRQSDAFQFAGTMRHALSLDLDEVKDAIGGSPNAWRARRTWSVALISPVLVAARSIRVHAGASQSFKTIRR